MIQQYEWVWWTRVAVFILLIKLSIIIQQSNETMCTLLNLADDKKPTATIVPMHRMVASDGLSALVTEEEPRLWGESLEHVEKSAK